MAIVASVGRLLLLTHRVLLRVISSVQLKPPSTIPTLEIPMCVMLPNSNLLQYRDVGANLCDGSFIISTRKAHHSRWHAICTSTLERWRALPHEPHGEQCRQRCEERSHDDSRCRRRRQCGTDALRRERKVEAAPLGSILAPDGGCERSIGVATVAWGGLEPLCHRRDVAAVRAQLQEEVVVVLELVVHGGSEVDAVGRAMARVHDGIVLVAGQQLSQPHIPCLNVRSRDTRTKVGYQESTTLESSQFTHGSSDSSSSRRRGTAYRER